MPVITCIDDLKRLYRRRVPRMFYDYAESGSWTEQTFRDNVADFAELRLRQRIAVDMTGRSTAATMIGEPVVSVLVKRVCRTISGRRAAARWRAGQACA